MTTRTVTADTGLRLIGRTHEGDRVYAEIRIEHRGPEYTTTGDLIEKQTTDHRTVTEYDTVSISGAVVPKGHKDADQFGQCRDALDTIDMQHKDTIAPTKLRALKRLWDTRHLNDMKAACVHQDGGAHVNRETGGWHDKGVWDAQTAKCPEGYRYGSAWLLDVIPEDELQDARDLAAYLECMPAYRGN